MDAQRKKIISRGRLSGWLFCYCLAILLGATSCGDSASDASKQARPVFHYNQPNNLTSLDPAFARSQNNIWAVDHLYNGLVQLDEALNVQAALAERWTISEDGRIYTFTLRDDVYFHDNPCFPDGKGRRVRAQDVQYSFERILDEEVGSPGAWIFKGKIAEQNAFAAPDERTFVLTLKQAFRPMLGILTMQYCSVVPPEGVTYYGATFRQNPVGTGPFRFKRWLDNQALFLMKNEQYFEQEQAGALPRVDGIRVSFIADRKTAFLELIMGKLDLISGLESSYVNELLTADGDLRNSRADRLQFLKSPYLNTEYIGINLAFGDDRFPLRNKKVRQALNFGIDRPQMLRTLRNSVGKSAVAGFTPIGLPSYSATQTPGYYYDPDKAAQLLAEAGFPNGVGLAPLTLMTNSNYEDLCTFMAKQWEDLGIKVKVELQESGTLRQMMTKGQAPFFRASWIADYPDAESFFTVFYSKNPAPPNYTRFKNETFDQLYEQALGENNDSTRYALYQEMDRILIEEAPVIFLFYDQTALFARRNVEGLSKNAINLLSVKRIQKTLD
ncbi:MAG: ABC transporter substrate-binding protein [Bacteroidota bacterium]